ncbi:DNA-binding IclR family transcriptional regulator [Kitasatospora acidiphila]
MRFAEEVPPTAGPGAFRNNDLLEQSLGEVRRLGYAIGREECMAGWNSVAAPVTWGDQVMGSVLSLFPLAETPSDLGPMIHHTLRTARAVSLLIGSPHTAHPGWRSGRQSLTCLGLESSPSTQG